MAKNIEFEGEIIHPELSFVWVKAGTTIPAGHAFVPVSLPSDTISEEFAALHLITNDLKFALYCFEEALKLGLPDDTNLLARALVSAGVLAYAKPFDQGLRKFKFRPEDFDTEWTADSKSLHSYLHALRQKHIAHSANDCERSETVGVVVLNPERKLDKDAPSGIGVTMMSSVGVSRKILHQSIAHVQAQIIFVEKRIEELRPLIHEELRKKIDSGFCFEMAPVVKFPDRAKVGDRRG